MRPGAGSRPWAALALVLCTSRGPCPIRGSTLVSTGAGSGGRGALTPAAAQYGAPVADVGLPGVSAWVVPLASAGPPAAAARLHVYEERAAAHAPTVCDPCRIIGAPLLGPGRLPRGARRALRPGPWGAGLGRRSGVPARPQCSGWSADEDAGAASGVCRQETCEAARACLAQAFARRPLCPAYLLARAGLPARELRQGRCSRCAAGNAAASHHARPRLQPCALLWGKSESPGATLPVPVCCEAAIHGCHGPA